MGYPSVHPATWAVQAVCTAAVLVTHFAYRGVGFPYWPLPEHPSYDPGPWCERERLHDFLREPANSLSDLGFLFASLYMFQCGIQDAQKLRAGIKPDTIVGGSPEVSIIFGVANFFHFAAHFRIMPAAATMATLLTQLACTLFFCSSLYTKVGEQYRRAAIPARPCQLADCFFRTSLAPLRSCCTRTSFTALSVSLEKQ